MATDLETGLLRLKAISDHSTPTPANRSLPNLSHDTNNHIIIPPENFRPEEIGAVNVYGHSRLLPIDMALDADRNWLSRGEDINHASTPPIDVPQPRSSMDLEWQVDKNDPESSYFEPSPLDEYMQNRRTSVSFHPQVTLETGQQQPLEEPLPRKLDTLPKLGINTKTRRKSLIYEACHPSIRSPLSRVHSESDSTNYDSVTGELLPAIEQPDPPKRPTDLAATHQQQPILISTEYAGPRKRTSTDSGQGVSLTSDSTASPITSELQTPTEAMDLLLSPISTFPPLAFPTSYEDSSAWPMPRRQSSMGPRAKSYNIERGFSMRSAQRHNSRASTRRSTSNSSSASPATAFLSKFAVSKLEPAPEPDSEGQEVGEYVLGRQLGFGGFSVVREAYTLEGDERICRAVKIVRKQIIGREESENEQLQAEFEHEVGLWRCLAHRNILPLIEVYETNIATFCFTKLNTGGTLFDLVRVNRRGLSRDLSRRYAYQLASAIRYLHEDVRVVHRDIKLENCLIDVSDPDVARDGGNLLLCDFGLAEFVTHDLVRGSPDPYERTSGRPPPKNIGPSESSTSIAGSLQYASPELILSPAGFLSSVVDVWAFGVVIYALLVGDLPFQHTFQPRVQMMILAGEWNAEALETAKGVVGHEDEVSELMCGCLDMQSEQRWTIGQVLGSRWLKGCQEMLEEYNGAFKL